MAYYLDFIQLQYILLTFGFPFGPFKSYHKILVSFLMVSNFGLGDGKIWKSQYRIFLEFIIAVKRFKLRPMVSWQALTAMYNMGLD
jgi:hypothetical protein